MKALTTILLALLFLGGLWAEGPLHQEPTELEKCIEANKLPNEYYDKWLEMILKVVKYEKENQQTYIEENPEDFAKSLNRIELSMMACTNKGFRLLNFDNPESLEEAWEIRMSCLSEINGKEMERVKKLCNE